MYMKNTYHCISWFYTQEFLYQSKKMLLGLIHPNEDNPNKEILSMNQWHQSTPHEIVGACLMLFGGFLFCLFFGGVLIYPFLWLKTKINSCSPHWHWQSVSHYWTTKTIARIPGSCCHCVSGEINSWMSVFSTGLYTVEGYLFWSMKLGILCPRLNVRDNSQSGLLRMCLDSSIKQENEQHASNS